eukprot:TRINITY_DN23652_c0_g1_i1.p1 TRINITY_DN23652_c0_g1~~TRINITY_DN23652_c0_g1_i1.p1  ORF type:complete len:375 (-),score=35.90 TRINITY_DN23652_c0_g1_i1:113-1237(-)
MQDEDEDCPVAIPLQEERELRPTNYEFPIVKQVSKRRTSKVPVTILTGCLGAGKTTLLNRIISENHGYRIAVVMNELGQEKGIEGVAFDRRDADGDIPGVEEWIELSNGCVCCNVKNDLLIALEGLLEKNLLFDYIVIETTGVANPGPVAASLWVDDALESSVYLDAVVTVVDAKLLLTQLQHPQEHQAEQQIAYADVIIINKIDLVSSQQMEGIQNAVRGINAMAQLFTSERCKMDVGILLNRENYKNKTFDKPSMVNSDHHHSHHHKVSNVSTISIRIDQPLDLERVKTCLDSLLWEEQNIDVDNIYRMKGILWINHCNFKYVLQAVHDLYEVVETQQKWQIDESLQSRIVVIGKGLDKPKLEKIFLQCVSL